MGPLRFHFANSGLSSISVGGRGASFNIPVAQPGRARTTVGLPGTGLSWRVEAPAGPAAGLPNSRRLRPAQVEAFKGNVLAVLQQEVFGPGTPAGTDRDPRGDRGLHLLRSQAGRGQTPRPPLHRSRAGSDSAGGRTEPDQVMSCR
ncbi:MAG: DUF4236 domain-containing protein [Prochlorococcaceae cyanobacterium]